MRTIVKKAILLVKFFAFWFLSAHSQSLSQRVETIRQEHDVMGGAIVVFCQDQILENISFGKADFARNIDVSTRTKFRFASVSKTISTIAVMKLAEQGTLNLDADINTILGYSVRNPNHPQTPITTRMLLSHTSTLIDGTTYNSFLSATNNNNPIPNISQLISAGGSHYSTSLFVNRVPGTYFSYSNLNFGIVGTIIEKLSNQRFDLFCKSHIFDPLGIEASYNVNHLPNINDIAVLYRKTGGTWVAQADNFQGVQPTFGNIAGYIPGTNGLRFAPQGGLRISAIDMAKLMVAILNGGIVDQVQVLQTPSVTAMTTASWQFDGSNGNNYYGLFRRWGLGTHITTNTPANDIVLPRSSQMFGHPGEAYGLISNAYFDPVRKIGFVFVINGVGVGFSTGPSSAFYTIEKQVFDSIEELVDLDGCLTLGTTRGETGQTHKVYPNPFCDNIFVSTQGESFKTKIDFMNLTGNILQTKTKTSPLERIDTSGFKPGIYLVRVGCEVFKLVKNCGKAN